MIKVRSEQVADYHRIAEINALAFSSYLDNPPACTFVPEFALVDALRHGANFDPELSLVAEVDSAIVGHAFFFPHQVYVGGEELRAVSLGPIAVDPAFQHMGVGTQLLHEGHHRARHKGFAFSILLGHPSYYPRFGYLTNMFGECGLEVRVQNVPTTGETLAERLVLPKDVSWLGGMWRDWFEDVDLVVFPGESVLDWLSHTEEIMSVVVESRGESIGYIRYVKHNPTQVKMLLAKDKASVSSLLEHLIAKLTGTEADRILVPLHPDSQAVRAWFRLPFEPRVTTSEAAMIKVLDERNPAVTAYCESVSSGTRRPGLVIWPPCIEFA
jgi:predicted N-acetyltransferase YhbS